MITANGHQDLTLLEIMLQLTSDFRKALVPLRITPLQAGVLLYVSRTPGAGVFEISKILGLKPPTLVPVVQDLVRMRLVKRVEHSYDRRARPIVLAAKGQALVPRILNRVEMVSIPREKC